MADWRVNVDAEVVALLVSELVTNAIEHGGPYRPDTHVDLTIDSTSDGLRIDVADPSTQMPRVGEIDVKRSSGRGLQLVEALATDWGVDTLENGKSVWLRVAIDSPDIKVLANGKRR